VKWPSHDSQRERSSELKTFSSSSSSSFFNWVLKKLCVTRGVVLDHHFNVFWLYHQASVDIW
jgi:hypothetical protein